MKNFDWRKRTASPKLFRAAGVCFGASLYITATASHRIGSHLASWRTKLSLPRVRFSIRSFLLGFFILACALAFFRSFGAHLRWLPQHLMLPKYDAVENVSATNIQMCDEAMVEIQLSGIQFKLPKSMSGQMTINRGGGVWLTFRDAQRQFSIPFLNQTSPNLNWLSTRPEMAGWTAPRALKAVYDTSSNDFSWRLTRDEVYRHKWALTQRPEVDVFHNPLSTYRFYADDNFEWILRSSGPPTADRVKLLQGSKFWDTRGTMIWETTHHTMGGTLHFGDMSPNALIWIDEVARSFTLLDPSVTQLVRVSAMTDDEIKSSIKITDVADH